MSGSHDWLKKTLMPEAESLTGEELDLVLRPYHDPAAASEQARANAKLRIAMTEPRLDTELITALIAQGANFNIVIDGRPLVHHLVERRDILALMRLGSARFNNVYVLRRSDADANNDTALMLARKTGWSEGEEILRRNGFGDGHVLYSDEQSRMDALLAYGVSTQNTKFALAALILDANPAIRTGAGIHAYHHAIINLDCAVVNALAERGIDIHARHTRGETPLQMLWWVQGPGMMGTAWYDMVAFLRRIGADDGTFKTVEEMSDAELFVPPPGASKDSPAYDYALKSGKYDTFVRALKVAGPVEAYKILTERSALMQQKRIDIVMARDRLQEIFTRDIWCGHQAIAEKLWAGIAEHAGRTDFFRSAPCQFTARDMRVLASQLQKDSLQRQASRAQKFRL